MPVLVVHTIDATAAENVPAGYHGDGNDAKLQTTLSHEVDDLHLGIQVRMLLLALQLVLGYEHADGAPERLRKCHERCADGRIVTPVVQAELFLAEGTLDGLAGPLFRACAS